jgi:hypothetical protein
MKKYLLRQRINFCVNRAQKYDIKIKFLVTECGFKTVSIVGLMARRRDYLINKAVKLRKKIKDE